MPSLRDSLKLVLDKLGLLQHLDVSLQEVAGLDLQALTPDEQVGKGVREAGQGDAALLSSFGTSAETVGSRFRNGYRAWVVEEKGTLLALDWLTTSRKPFWDSLDLIGREGDVWHWSYEVAEGQRGRGLGTRIRRAVALRCKQAGYRWLLGNYALRNKASRRVMVKLGYQPVARLYYVRLGRLKAVVFRGRLHMGRWTEQERLRLDVP